MERLIFEYSKVGKNGIDISLSDIKVVDVDSYLGNMKREDYGNLPEVSELEVVRHFIKLSQLNFGVDIGFYPLGSCTMKYNPKVNEKAANLPGFSNIHPLAPFEFVQGALEIMYELEKFLSKITGMPYFALQPPAGASGEFTGILIMKKYHEKKGNYHKNEIIIPDSAHGTNPASVAQAGFKVVEIPSDKKGWIDINKLRQFVNENTAGLMITNPNTLGVFDGNISEIAKIVHNVDGLLHYDGANLNAIMGICRPYDMGFDIVHLNLHKTFSTPHGGGGPGAGPVGVVEKLKDFLPYPWVVKENGNFKMVFDCPDSIGKVIGFWGNFLVLVKAFLYIKMLGSEGLKEVSKTAVLNANYLLKKLENYFERATNGYCMHEFVLSGKNLSNGVTTLDVAKRLLDYGVHAPTIYFPLIVKEALMIEPTETETLENLDYFIDTMIKIVKEAEENPEVLKNAPHNTPIKRLNEVKAARKPVVRYKNG